MSDMIYKTAKVTTVHDKGEDHSIAGMITREVVDEEGELVIADGLDTQYHDRVGGVSVLFNHNMSHPVGKVRNLSRREDGWWGVIKLLDGATTELGDSLINLAKIGALHFSVGYKRLETRAPTPEERAQNPGVVMVTTKWQLMELTLTPVPAHADANLVVKQLRGLADEGKVSDLIVKEFDTEIRVNWDLDPEPVETVELKTPTW